MGDIYSAFDRTEERTVVVKLMRQALTADKDAKARFLNEARAVSAIQHDNVIRIFDIDEHRGRPYMVMEFLDGRDLKEHLKDNGPLRWEDVRRILIGVCDGIEAAHKAGIIHRDLKPQNIFILKTGKVKVLDLGLAKFMDNPSGPQTAVGMFAGTPDFAAPEQINDREKMDQRVDIYALGIIIYNMVSGDMPFTSAKRDAQAANLEILTMHLNSQPIPPSVKHPELNIPVEVEGIILKAMQKKKEDRYGDVGELRDAILRCEGSTSNMSVGSVLLGQSLRTRAVAEELDARVPASEPTYKKPRKGSFKRTMLLVAALAASAYAYVGRDKLGKYYEELRTGVAGMKFEVPHAEPPKQELKAESQPQAAPKENPQNTFMIKIDSDPAGSIVYDVTPGKPPVELGITPLNRELEAGEHKLLVTSSKDKRMQKQIVVSPQHHEEKVDFRKAAKGKIVPPAGKGKQELDDYDPAEDEAAARENLSGVPETP